MVNPKVTGIPPEDAPAWAIRLDLYDPAVMAGKWVKRIRKAVEMCQLDFADDIGVHEHTLRMWEYQKKQPTFQSVIHLLVFELRAMATVELPFEETLLAQLLTTQGVIREETEVLVGRDYRTVKERRNSLRALMEGIGKLLESEAVHAVS